MRKFTLALIAAMIPVSAMSADFSGTWVRDSARSKPVPYPNYWLTRVTPGAGGGQNQLYVMRIQQSATDVQISDPLHNLRSYALDGKPRGSRTDTGMGNVTTTAAMALWRHAGQCDDDRDRTLGAVGRWHRTHHHHGERVAGHPSEQYRSVQEAVICLAPGSRRGLAQAGSMIGSRTSSR